MGDRLRKVLTSRWTWSGGLAIALSFLDKVLSALERMHFIVNDLLALITSIGMTVYEMFAYPPPFVRVVLILIGLGLIWYGNSRQNLYSSSLSIDLQEDLSPFYVEFAQDGRLFQCCRVRVINDDKTSAIDCVNLKIVNISPQPNALYALPIPLHFSNDHKQPYDDSKLFSEGRAEFFDVITASAPNGGDAEMIGFNRSNAQLFIEHAVQGENRAVPIRNYTIELQASGTGVPDSTPKKFYARLEGGRLRMTEIREPTWLRKFLKRR